MPVAKNPRPERSKLPFEVWALVAGAFAVALGYGVVAPAIPQFAREFGVTNLAASAIVSAFALMRLVSAPFAGWVVTKFGERRTYATGILIVAISTGACAFATTYPMFLVLRGLGGIGSAMFTIAASALLIKVSPPATRGRIASVNASGFLLGGLLGPVFGGLVAGFGLRAPFVFYFITLVIAATVVWISLRKSTLAAASTPGATIAPLSLPEAFGRPDYRALLTSVFTFGWASFGVRISVVPLFAAATFTGNVTAAAWVLAAYAAGNALLILPAGKWSDTFGRKPLLVTGLSILAVSYAFFPFASELWLAIIIMTVAGCGSALVSPGQQAALADIVGQRKGGQVVATFSMTSDLGGVLGPLIAGALVDAAGFGSAFWLTAAMLAIAAIVWLRVNTSSQRLATES